MTKILIRIFAAGFYKLHAGLLLTLFVSLFINFFFTSVLNQTHLSQEQILLNNLKLVLTSVSNPVAMGVLFMIWLCYTFKSCQYIAAQLTRSQHQFLFYSINALSLRKQFQTWLVVQSVILIPIIFSGIFAMVVGFAFGYNSIPFIIPFYLLILLSGSSFYCTGLLNNLREQKSASYIPDLIKSYPKPFFSLFLFQILYLFKLSYSISKVISVILIMAMYTLFGNSVHDIRIGCIAMLGIIAGHSVLIYQSHEFGRFYQFNHNFPLGRGERLLHFTALYILLILPEIILLFCLDSPMNVLMVVLLGLAYALLIRTLLFWQNFRMGDFLKIVFGLFILFALLIMSGFLHWVIIVLPLFSVLVFYRNYYKFLE